jgi:hypothetical protein
MQRGLWRDPAFIMLLLQISQRRVAGVSANRETVNCRSAKNPFEYKGYKQNLAHPISFCD